MLWVLSAILWQNEALLLVFFALLGGVAQLGERRVRNAKVEGSIPFSSTIPRGRMSVSGLYFLASVAQWIERVPPKR
jgi:hypothetical protein